MRLLAEKRSEFGFELEIEEAMVGCLLVIDYLCVELKILLKTANGHIGNPWLVY